MKKLLLIPLHDVLAGMEPVMRIRNPIKAMAPMLLAMLVTWFLYVPVHELLHVLGCVGTGGEVTELSLRPWYGGTILQQYFDFIVPDSNYAGQLTGFDTNGSDLVYLATDFLPFTLSVLFGVPLLRFCTRKRHPILLGPAIVLGMAPFYNLPGDYYEMSSIITTRVVTMVFGEDNADNPSAIEPPQAVEADANTPVKSASTIQYECVRSDDVFSLISNIFTKPKELGLPTAGSMIVAIVLVLVSIDVSIVLAFITYFLGDLVARATIGPPRIIQLDAPRRRPTKRRKTLSQDSRQE